MQDAVVLFVDDEQNILKSLKRGLFEKKFEKYFATSANEALTILAKKNISILVTDLRMPGIDGIELSQIVTEKYPKITKIVLTGYYQVTTILAAINKGHVDQYLTKPIKIETELLPALIRGQNSYLLKHQQEVLIKELEKKNQELKDRNNIVEDMMLKTDNMRKNRSKIIVNIANYIEPFLEKMLNESTLQQNHEDDSIREFMQFIKEESKSIQEKVTMIRSIISKEME